jgi:hypothetical protein
MSPSPSASTRSKKLLECFFFGPPWSSIKVSNSALVICKARKVFKWVLNHSNQSMNQEINDNLVYYTYFIINFFFFTIGHECLDFFETNILSIKNEFFDKLLIFLYSFLLYIYIYIYRHIYMSVCQ